jgi:imidazolonepropionase-like amidohydrolase
MILIAAALLSAVAADTTRYVVLNHGRDAGAMVVIRNGDSTFVSYNFIDRNRGTRVESRFRVGSNGAIVGGESRFFTVDGRQTGMNSFEIVRDSVRRSGGQGGTVTTVRRDADTYYGPVGGTPYERAMFARYVLRRPNRTVKLPNGSSARVEVVKDTTVQTKAGRQRVRLAMIWTGNGNSPFGIWIDDKDAVVASDVGWFITVKPNAIGALGALRAVEVAYRDAQAAAMAKRLTKPVTGALVIKNGDLFDSERGVVRQNVTVVIEKDRITAVGPADSVKVPAGATVIDATGKAIVPGLWDMHGHMQLTSETGGSISQLSFGLTTVRDLASDLDVAVTQRDAARAGRVAGPREILAGFIEGPGKWAGPSEVLARTEDEARQWVARYDSMGYKQIKLYNLVHPDLVPTIAAEAHKRGMRLSGHIPRGLTVPAAVQLGFDEINHAAFLFSTFYQESLYVPTMRAYSAVAQSVASNINVDGPDMTRLIEFLKQHNTVLDGTFNVWITSGNSGIGPAVSGAVPSDAQKADANYLRLIKRLYDAGVTMVPGTDNSAGTTYNNELEVYEKAGLPAPFVLQMATIISARVMKDDAEYGSIAPGKVADLIVVDGKPAERVADLRKVQRVVRAGRLYDVADLKAAVGLTQP